MKAIKNQLKCPIDLRSPIYPKKDIKTCHYSILFAVDEEQQKDDKQN